MTASDVPPKALKLHRQSRHLELVEADDRALRLSFEYLRVYSPSAEVQGHGAGEPQLVPGKRNVGITRVEPVGRYAVRLVFDDGHDSGLYTWIWLRRLAAEHCTLWPQYLDRLKAAGASRDSDVVKLSALPKKYHPAK